MAQSHRIIATGCRGPTRNDSIALTALMIKRQRLHSDGASETILNVFSLMRSGMGLVIPCLSRMRYWVRLSVSGRSALGGGRDNKQGPPDPRPALHAQSLSLPNHAGHSPLHAQPVLIYTTSSSMDVRPYRETTDCIMPLCLWPPSSPALPLQLLALSIRHSSSALS